MEFVSDDMHRDGEVAGLFVDVLGLDALEFFTIGLAANRELVLKAMSEDPASRETVLEAIACGYDGGNMDPEWYSIIEELRDDREFVLAAIRLQGYPIVSLPSEFCADPEVILCALGHAVKLGADSWWASQKIPPVLLQDRGFVLEALRLGRDDVFILALGSCPALQYDHELLAVAFTVAEQSMDLSVDLGSDRWWVRGDWLRWKQSLFRMDSLQEAFVAAVERLQPEPLVCLGRCQEITAQGLARSRHRQQRRSSRCRAKAERRRQCLGKQRLRGGRFKPGEEAARLHRLET